MANPYNFKIGDQVFFPVLEKMGNWNPESRGLILNQLYSIDNIGNYNFNIPNCSNTVVVSFPKHGGWQPAGAVLPAYLMGEVGKWYKFKGYIETIIYGKFTSIDLNYLKCSEWIIASNKHLNHDGAWELHPDMKLDLATQEELNAMLPDGHADKIPLVPQYKEGDIVVATGNISGYNRLKGRINCEHRRMNMYSVNFQEFNIGKASFIWAEVHELWKSPEKWSVDTYVVYKEDKLLTNVTRHKADIVRIIQKIDNYIELDGDKFKIGTSSAHAENLEWFPTKEEAENFAKELFISKNVSEAPQVSPEPTHVDLNLEFAIKNYPIGTKIIPINSDGEAYSDICPAVTCTPFYYGNGKNIDAGTLGFIYAADVNKWAEIVNEAPVLVKDVCEDCNGTGKTMKAKLYPLGHTEETIDCPTCNGGGVIEKEHYTPAVGDWVPQVGEYAIMMNAGGWGYYPDNNGCIAKITEVNSAHEDYEKFRIAGVVCNPRVSPHDNKFDSIPMVSSKQQLWRLATAQEVANLITSNSSHSDTVLGIMAETGMLPFEVTEIDKQIKQVSTFVPGSVTADEIQISSF